MVQGVGGTGSSGSIKDLTAYQAYYPMYQSYIKYRAVNLSFEAWLIKEGYIQNFNQKVENYIETGNQNVSDGKNGNTIDAFRHLSSGNNAIYQAQDEDTYYEFDYDQGTYRKIQGKEEIGKVLGMPSGNNIDTINFGFNSAIITDYVFGDLEDGQDSKSYALNGKYGGVNYTKQEFDVHYILNALLMDPTDPQYNIAKDIFDKLCANVNQWLPVSEQKDLDKIAKEFGHNSAEYKEKLQKVLIEYLDQADEWIEEHTHVKNVNSGSLTETDKPGGSDDGSTGETENKTASIPGSYDRNNVMYNSAISSDYTAGISRNSDYAEQSKGMLSSMTTQARADLESAAASLRATLGENCTPEVEAYITKAIQNTLNSFSAEVDRHNSDSFDCTSNTFEFHRRSGTKKGRMLYNVKNLVNVFFDNFNSLCANNGKTPAEVEAEKKAAEEKKAKETAAYQSLYNTNISSIAQDAGISNSVQVVSPKSAADIQKKAETDILGPLKAKIKAQFVGKGISDADLNTILENASKAALTDCTEWATTSNNYVYTIDTNLLINKFQSNVKTIINNKGYNF